jgi:hypothetical protein
MKANLFLPVSNHNQIYQVCYIYRFFMKNKRSCRVISLSYKGRDKNIVYWWRHFYNILRQNVRIVVFGLSGLQNNDAAKRKAENQAFPLKLTAF